VEVLTKVYMALGTPSDASWGGLRNMPAFVEFQQTPAPGLRKIFPASVVGVSSALTCLPDPAPQQAASLVLDPSQL
jgi:hypothetical protein